MSFFKKKKLTKIKKAPMPESERKPAFPTIEENVQYIYEAFYRTDDLKKRKVKVNQVPGCIVYLNTMADPDAIQKNFLVPLSQHKNNRSIEEIITAPEISRTNDLNKVVDAMLKGDCALLLEGRIEVILFKCIQVNARTPDEPENEKVVRGSHEGFVEKLDKNLNLIRERIQNRQLTIKLLELGMESNSNVAIIYMSEIADPAVVKEVDKRLHSISSDMVFSPGYIEECIEDHPYSPFQQILYTERPDRVEAHLMDGRVAIMSEGTSDASIVPVTFFAFFHTPDDFNIRFYGGSVFRLLRLFSFWGALTFPPLYIAIVGFHFEIIPHDVVTMVKSSIENIPFPPFVEALIMAITIELIREAGIRLPTPIGQTIGIVGGLIIGDAVVNAGMVSNIMVIVIALTAIMSFSIPSYEMGNTVRILSLPIMISAATLGFVGIVFSLMIIIIHMCKLSSFGTPYISPLAPLNLKDLKDTFVRLPIWTMNRRPSNVHSQNPIKQKDSREWEKNEG